MTIPTEYGGHGLGITEATILLEESPSPRRHDGASAIHLSIFGMQPVVVHAPRTQGAHVAPVATGRCMCASE